MATAVKERINTNFQKAKEEGTLRADRIREIVKEAVTLSVDELKSGSSEIRTVAADAIAAVIDLVKDKGQAAKADVAASVEGVIEGIKASRQTSLDHTQGQVEQLQTQLDQEVQQLNSDVETALVAIETTAQTSDASPDFKALFASLIEAIKETRQFAGLQEQYAKLRGQLHHLDGKLAERYGDRYEQVKHQLEKYWETAKVWYEKTRTEVKTGSVDPVTKFQTEFSDRFAKAGTNAAKAEQGAKAKIGELLRKEATCEVADPE